MVTIKAFNRWDCEGIALEDAGLRDYVTLTPVIVPKTGARYIGNRFHKSRIFIVERLINKLMIPGHRAKKHKLTSGHCTGKGQTVYTLVENAFTIVEQKMKQNPILVFVKGLEYACPREEIITIEYGGARYPKAVECAPQRRIDLALRHMVQGAYARSFNGKLGAAQCLADEIIGCYQLSPKSNAITKKFELERQADASR
ncbi:30S ribosomal protein S7 [Candidatus Woesearchaeota archaeon]|nr:30S ribosomal protein S7 [Candidatus Woesearchaeota archaeon]